MTDTVAILNTIRATFADSDPEKFNINPRRDAPSAVSQPSGARQNDGSKSFDSIPRADQEAYEKHRKMMESKGVKYTKAEFMADYAL